MDCSSKIEKIYRLSVHLGLKRTIDQLNLANSVRLFGHVLRREDDCLLRRALDFEVNGQRKKGRSRRTWKKQIEEEHVRINLRREVQSGVLV